MNSLGKYIKIFELTILKIYITNLKLINLIIVIIIYFLTKIELNQTKSYTKPKSNPVLFGTYFAKR